MQALVGLFCFSLLLATGTCLECEYCSAFKEDCTGKLQLCGEGQDTCATILTETIIGKANSFTVVKSCYQTSKCVGSKQGNSFIKVNVNIKCSSSPAGKMGLEALVLESNELPDNQFLVRPKSRAAADLNANAGNRQGGETPKTTKIPEKPPTEKPKPPTEKPKPPTEKPKPPTEKPKPPTEKPKPPTPTPTGDAHQTIASFLLALSSLLLMNLFL
ncbi:myosin light chain kinase, smooth muscle-like [Ahaetulla prasina]|uniref:myosin light chain kinase, smooth muscle-like n=1 Tax=Ahaetulla prasina TaxID=499056 RepID=UPI00264A4363|nr:myosin light chain kinase, smooth muscle-like [Ahaetulla prasina]